MATTLPDDPNIAFIYDTAKEWIAQHEAPNASNIISFATCLMSAVQKIVTEHGRGSYKARIVMTVARKVVREVEYEDESQRKAAIDLVETMLPGALTAIKMASAALANSNFQPKCCC